MSKQSDYKSFPSNLLWVFVLFIISGLALHGFVLLPSGTVFGNQHPEISLSKDSFSSSTVCGRCHLEIYDHWRNSLHARSVEDPIFKTAYYEAYATSSGEAKFLCLKCHAPTTQVTKDFDLKGQISKEGVTCDYCHSVMAINSKNDGDFYKVQLGLTKTGPWKDSKSKAHQSAYSPLFESSTFCSGCHEFVNKHGVRVLETYSEWERSIYSKEGITCQNCHMPRIEGLKVASGPDKSTRNYVNLHKLAGGSSLGQLQRALVVDITSMERQGNDLVVGVALTNEGAGHMVPTGLPGRSIVLEVVVREGGFKLQSREQAFQKILLDGEGREIEKLSQLFDAQAIAQDNRIAPRETRYETFRFAVAPSQKAEVSVKVYYLYEPHLIEKKQVKVEVVGKDRVAPAARKGE
jgi:hypothetical protein